MVVVGQLTLDSGYDDVASAIVGEAKRRGHSRDEAVAELATGIQESSLNPRAHNPAGPWDGIYQQDRSYPGRFAPDTQITGFMDRLDVKRAAPGHGDIWLNIFWLQQRPGEPSAAVAYAKGRRAYMTEIQSRTGEATRLVDKYWGGTPAKGGTVVSGDPLWLENVLRPVLGDRLKTLDGWQDSGTGGTMRDIWGMVWHHTGNAKATAQSIRDGRPDLRGPLSQLHMAQDGTVTIVAVGPCNHAGPGSWTGLPTDDANDRTIGIEMAWPRDTTITEATQRREDWPPAMIQSMLDVGAAVAIKLGFPDGSHNISHSEWARYGPAGYRQGKWDPGNLNMGWIRDHIGARVQELSGKPPVPVPPAPLTDRQLLERIAADVAEIRAQLGTGDPSWDPIEATEEPGVHLTVRDAIDTLVERGNKAPDEKGAI